MTRQFAQIDNLEHLLSQGVFRIGNLGTFRVKFFRQRKISRATDKEIITLPDRFVLKFTQSAQVKRALKNIKL